MLEKKIELNVKILKKEDLSDDNKRLRLAAIEAAKHAYAPYSQFCVGAAVLLEDGTIVSGSNQENAAYPSGLCAERVALFSAGASYPDVPVISIAVVALKGGNIQPAVSPCGGCRQVMLETKQRYGKHVSVLMCGHNDVIIASVEDLLPLCFGRDNL